jgi:hypothetical protein
MRVRIVWAVLCIGCGAPAVNLTPGSASFAVRAPPDVPSVRVAAWQVVAPAYALVAPDDGHRLNPIAKLTRPSRVTLEDGRLLVCWVSHDVELGNRAFAQSFETDGTPRGLPVVISPEQVDVVAAPETTATGGHRAVTRFAAATESSVQLLAVSLEGL